MGRSFLRSITTGDRLCEFLPRQGPVHEPGHEPHDEPVGGWEGTLEEIEELDIGGGNHHELVPLDGVYDQVGHPFWLHGVSAEQVTALSTRLLIGVDDCGLNDVGVHCAGEYHANPYVVLTQVEPQDLGAANQGMLGAGVGHMPGQADDSRCGRYRKQVATPAGADHLRHEALDSVVRPPEVDVYYPFPLVVCHVLHLGEESDPRDVGQYVQGTELGMDLIGSRLKSFVIGDV